MKYWVILGTLILQLSLAQLCTGELEGVITEDLALPATGIEAASLMHHTIEILEPVLPRLAYLPEPFGYVDYPSAVYLAEHGLLPALWEPESLSFEVWQEMMIGVAAWYDLDVQVSPDLSRAGLILALGELIEKATSRVNPVALIASEDEERTQVAFLAVVRNDSVYPRLIVYRPEQNNLGLSEGMDKVLTHLGTCAYKITDYIFAPEQTAKRLFLANNDGRMLMASTFPVRPEELTYVPQGEETAYLTFASAELEPYTMYAALFEGSGINPVLLTRLLARVRTNMNPKEVLDFVMGN